MAKPKKTKRITNVKLNELLGVSVYTLTDWAKCSRDDSRFKIYTLLKSMTEEEILDRLKNGID